MGEFHSYEITEKNNATTTKTSSDVEISSPTSDYDNAMFRFGDRSPNKLAKSRRIKNFSIITVGITSVGHGHRILGQQFALSGRVTS